MYGATSLPISFAKLLAHGLMYWSFFEVGPNVKPSCTILLMFETTVCPMYFTPAFVGADGAAGILTASDRSSVVGEVLCGCQRCSLCGRQIIVNLFVDIRGYYLIYELILALVGHVRIDGWRRLQLVFYCPDLVVERHVVPRWQYLVFERDEVSCSLIRRVADVVEKRLPFGNDVVLQPHACLAQLAGLRLLQAGGVLSLSCIGSRVCGGDCTSGGVGCAGLD